MAKKKFDIDQGFHQLDEILTKLSSEEIKLPEAVKLYTEGVNLVKQCKDSLDKDVYKRQLPEQSSDQRPEKTAFQTT